MQIEPTNPAAAQQVQQVRQLVQTLLGQTFFGTLIKQMRESPFKSDMLAGGRAGQTYQRMLDAKLAEQMGRSITGPLVESMTRQLVGSRRLNEVRQLQAQPLQDATDPTRSQDGRLDLRA